MGMFEKSVTFAGHFTYSRLDVGDLGDVDVLERRRERHRRVR